MTQGRNFKLLLLEILLSLPWDKGLVFSLLEIRALFPTREGIKSVVLWRGSRIREFLKSGQYVIKLLATAKTDVAVRVGRSIIQIQREATIVGAIVPIAAADSGAISI